MFTIDPAITTEFADIYYTANIFLVDARVDLLATVLKLERLGSYGLKSSTNGTPECYSIFSSLPSPSPLLCISRPTGQKT
jgi:hypothetical protein